MQKEQKRRDKKRRQEKEKKKLQLREKNSSLIYEGNKYKTAAMLPYWTTIEHGIYLAYVASNETLVDKTVAAALEKFIRDVRTGATSRQLAVTTDSARETMVSSPDGNNIEFVISNIRISLAISSARHPKPTRDTLVGVMRSILGSLDAMTTQQPNSQGYLKHMIRFQNELGLSISEVSGDLLPDEMWEEELPEITFADHTAIEE